MPNPLPKLEEMTDILDIRGVPALELLWVWILAGSILLSLLGYLLYRWWQARKIRPAFRAPKTPLQTALEKLDELVNSRLIESGQIRRFYFSLSDIFREFIEREIGIKACEATLEELRPELKCSEQLEAGEVEQAIWFLELAELAKFARFTPSREDIIKSVRICRVWMTQLASRREQQRKSALEDSEDESEKKAAS